MVAGVEGLFGLAVLGLGSLVFGEAVAEIRSGRQLAAAQDQYFSVVAHEVRNSLTGTVGLARLLDEEWESIADVDRRSMAQAIATASRSLGDMVGDVLDTARVRRQHLSVAPEVVDLARIVQEIGLDCPNDPVLAWADPHRTSQIVRNLVKNARDHGREPIEVEVTTREGRAFVEVRDSGDGVSPDVATHLFQPFVTSGGPTSTGLGLWLSYELAEAMDGSLAYDRAGGWTRFTLTLPTP
ncbi:MAG: sensor histidine kinase [Acidimicrobiia bacterium]